MKIFKKTKLSFRR